MTKEQEMDIALLISKNLKRIAYENGKTQADIAKDLHISKATVSSWMNGTRIPRMDKIDKLCHYFNCSRADIMSEQKPQAAAPYYLTEETLYYAQQFFSHPEYRVLFDAAENVSAENIQLAAEMLRRMKETNPNG